MSGLITAGSLTKTAVAPGAELVAYSGFSTSNYAFSPYNADLDFGTGDFHVMGWVKESPNGSFEVILERKALGIAQGQIYVAVQADGTVRWRTNDLTTSDSLDSPTPIDDSIYHFVVCAKRSGSKYLYIDGELVSTSSPASNDTLSNTAAILGLGYSIEGTSPLTNGSLALWRMGAGAPTAEQIEYIYNNEKGMFEPDSKITLAGTSDAILALDYDDATEQTHALTSYGRSSFQNGVMVESEATAVGTPACIASSEGDIGTGGSTAVTLYSPAENLRSELLQQEVSNPLALEPFWFVGDAIVTDFALPAGWKSKFVYDGGALVKDGAGDEYVVLYDGFIYTVSFAVAPANGNDVCIMGVR